MSRFFPTRPKPDQRCRFIPRGASTHRKASGRAGRLSSRSTAARTKLVHLGTDEDGRDPCERPFREPRLHVVGPEFFLPMGVGDKSYEVSRQRSAFSSMRY